MIKSTLIAVPSQIFSTPKLNKLNIYLTFHPFVSDHHLLSNCHLIPPSSAFSSFAVAAPAADIICEQPKGAVNNYSQALDVHRNAKNDNTLSQNFCEYLRVSLWGVYLWIGFKRDNKH